jgi:hypothetical protein
MVGMSHPKNDPKLGGGYFLVGEFTTPAVK